MPFFCRLWKLSTFGKIISNSIAPRWVLPEANSEPNQTSKMDYFVKIVKGFYPLTILAKCSNIDVGQASEYASDCSPQLSDIWYSWKSFFAFYNNNSDIEGNSND